MAMEPWLSSSIRAWEHRILVADFGTPDSRLSIQTFTLGDHVDLHKVMAPPINDSDGSLKHFL